MSDRAYAKAQAQQKTLTGSSPKNSLLQRTCACGGSPGIDGLCTECRDKQLTSQSSRRGFEAPSASAVTQGNSSVQDSVSSLDSVMDRTSRFSHDFSQIPIHSRQAAAPQTKLTVNQPGDIYEQEADLVAEQVMRTADPESPVSDEEDEAKNVLIRKQSAASGPNAVTEFSNVPPIVHAVLNSSSGQPLNATTREFMEPRFGHDFSRVRVHTDEQAAESARSVNALAYTVGGDVVFGTGQYAPETSTGRSLMAHELAHVVQQSQQVYSAANTTMMRAVDAPPSKEVVWKEITALEIIELWNQLTNMGLAPTPEMLAVEKLLQLKLNLVGATDATQQKIFFFRTRIFELRQKKATVPSLFSQEDQDIFEFEIALAQALKDNIQRLKIRIATLSKQHPPDPGLAIAQAELKQNETEEKTLSMIFSPEKAKEFGRTYSEDLKGKCMATFIQGVGALYTKKEAATIKKEALTAAEKHDKPLHLKEPNDTFSVDRLMDAVRSHSKAGKVMTFKHNPKTERWEPDIEQTLLSMTSSDCPGWYFFGASLHGAFHSVIFAVNTSGEGKHKIFWMDEFSTAGFSNDYEARAYHTPKNNVTGHIDEKMSKADDARKHFDEPTKIWQLIPTQ